MIPYMIVRQYTEEVPAGLSTDIARAKTPEEFWLVNVKLDGHAGEPVSVLSLHMELDDLLEAISTHKIYSQYLENLLKDEYEVVS